MKRLPAWLMWQRQLATKWVQQHLQFIVQAFRTISRSLSRKLDSMLRVWCHMSAVCAFMRAFQAASVGDGSCCFCWEPLVSAAVIPLACAAGHFVHLHCAEQRLQTGCPGPALTFDYLFCPLCGSGAEGRCGNIQVSLMDTGLLLRHGLDCMPNVALLGSLGSLSSHKECRRWARACFSVMLCLTLSEKAWSVLSVLRSVTNPLST